MTMSSDAAVASRAQGPGPASQATLFEFVRRLAGDLANDLELPGFPDVVVRLHRALGDPNTAVKDIVRLVSSEPALAARLVQLANSAAFKPGDRSASDLRTAITLLGFNVVRSTATTFAMRQLEQQTWLAPIRPHLARIWNDSTAVAAIAFVAARRVPGTRPDEALAAGLFHQLGGLYLLTRAHKEGIPLGSASEWAETIASWQPAIGRAILETWGSPGPLCEAVEHQDTLLDDDPMNMQLLTRLLAVAKVYRQSLAGDELAPELATCLAGIVFGTTPFLALMADAGPEVEKVKAVIGGA
jgi:HD-like signal output (HDOD) protein